MGNSPHVTPFLIYPLHGPSGSGEGIPPLTDPALPEDPFYGSGFAGGSVI